jgi:hypothetical protein
MRWIGAFATAAVVVLALSIVVQQDRKTPDPRSGDGIKLDAARPASPRKENAIGVSTLPESRLASPQSPAVLSSEESGYRSADEPDLAEGRAQFEDESPGMPAASARDNDVEEEPSREARPDLLRIDSSLQETAEDANDEIILTPDAWIEYMFELQKTQRHEELKVELEAFRKAYPDYPLPAELRD